MKLQTTIRKNGFVYNQIARTETTAIYEQTQEGEIISYEVFKIQTTKKDYTFPNGTLIKSGTERFPSNEDFGKTAWSIRNLDRAKKRFSELN